MFLGVVFIHCILNEDWLYSERNLFAQVVELADTLDLGSSTFGVGVRVPPWAPVFSIEDSPFVKMNFRY